MSVVATQIVTCARCGRKNRVPAVAAGAPRCGNCHNPIAWIATAGDDTFGEVVDEATIPVLVDMWATWCGPCRMVSPALEQVAQDLAGRLKLVKIDVDAAPKTSARFAVQAVPTLLVMRHGNVIAQRAGAASASVLRRWVEDSLTNASASRS
jgi:thioredoxin 2